MHTPPRALLALVVAISLVATALPASPFGLLGPAAASADLVAKAAPAAILQQLAIDGQVPVGPGVSHSWGRMVTGGGPQVVHLVQVQPGAPGITF